MNSPKHVAIIMDGNGRWGLKKKNSRAFGHQKGLLTVEKIIKASIKKKVKYLTLYVFSTENWKRPKNEIGFLLKLLQNYIDKEINNLIKNNIKVKVFGNLKPFSKKLKFNIKNLENLTKKNNKLQINLALNYGSREEIINAITKIQKSNIKINKKNFEKFLYTSGIPDPEILIRTGNTKRISNFMIWQNIYAEIFFEKKMWPDFNQSDFYKIINKFNKIRRNFGGLNVRN